MSTGDPARAPFSRGELTAILGVAVAVVGLAAYVSVVGWIVELVRFAAARLPAGATAAALSTREVFGDGLRSTLLMAAVFAVSCAFAYFSSARKRDVHGQDWHDIIRKRGVANAAADVDAREERCRRERLHASEVADRADRVAARSSRRGLRLITGVAGRIHSRNAQRAAGGPIGAPKPLKPAPLGDPAVRVIAGFNIMILSVLVALAVARAVGAAIPLVRWVGVLIGVLVFLAARWISSRKLGSR